MSVESKSESLVEATLTCSFDTGAHLIVRAQIIVNSINVFDTIYDRQEIENMATTNPYIMGAIMLRIHESLRTLVESAFTEAIVDTINTIPSYEHPYFIDDFQVSLTSSFFHYNNSLNLTDFIPGVLDMGATVTYHFDLQTEQGWDTTYIFFLPSDMKLTYANTSETNIINNKVIWSVQNLNGTNNRKDASLSIQAKHPTTLSSESEDISLEYILDTRTINKISFINSIIAKRININHYHSLPEFISGLDIIPADGIRLFIDNGLLTWDDLFEKTFQPIEQQITPHIENSSFNQSLNFLFYWDAESTMNCSTPFNISYMDDMPEIRANFKDPNVNLTIFQMPARAFFGLINAGATASISSDDINFGSRLNGITYPYDFIIYLPANISFNGDNVYIWNKTKPLTGIFSSDVQPNPTYIAEQTETYIEIEVLKMDLNIQSIFTGKTELTASTRIKEDDKLYVMKRTNDLPFSPKINITYLNSDVLRLCIEENVFTDVQLNSFLSKRTAEADQRLSQILHDLPVKSTIDNKMFLNSLIWDRDISTMDDVTPIFVSNYANEVYTIELNLSLWPVEMKLAPQQFYLESLKNHTIVYRIIFPQGIIINASENTGQSLITGKTSDGREYVELSFDAESTTHTTILTCSLNAAPVYIIGLFLPCILVFILLLVLVVIIYLIRKKRGGIRRGKRKRKLFEPEDNEPSYYDGEDYYIPPPPSSTNKKK